ncbi:RING finger protein 34 [Coemansia sp. D1744]|nr:RING finger protein 34 [Coemansia sp. D1744]
MFTALPFPATDAALPETVARAIQELNGPLCDTANVQYDLATPADRSRYSACPTCGITFGLFRRKHNCVNCGQVVCSDCLSNKWYLPKYGIKTPVSCCTMCNRNLQLSIKNKPELERCTIRELRAYLTVYGLYDPNKMIEKSDLVAAVYNNSPMPNVNECHYRLSLPRPRASAPAKSTIPELKDIVQNNADVGTLSVKVLKQLLAINHVDYSNIVEKQELVQRVQRLVDNHRLEMKSEEVAAARDSSDQYSEENTCKICLDAMSNCVFLNCGHMSTCLDCGNRILNSGRRECPICREYIAKVVHVFRA